MRTVPTANRYSPAGCISRFGQAGKVQRTKVVGAPVFVPCPWKDRPQSNSRSCKQSDWMDSSIRFESLSVTNEHRGCDG
jgi:hypothetical protein